MSCDWKKKKSDIWDCIKRVDTYISSSNLRTALLLTFVFAILTASYNVGLLKPSNIGPGYSWVVNLSVLLALFVSVSATVFYALSAIDPKTEGRNKSVYNFPGLGKQNDQEIYLTKNEFLNSNEEQDFENIYQQYVDLCQIATHKFEYHKKAVSWAKIGILGSTIILAIIHVVKC